MIHGDLKGLVLVMNGDEMVMSGYTMGIHGNRTKIPNYEWVKYIVTLRRDRSLESWFDCMESSPRGLISGW